MRMKKWLPAILVLGWSSSAVAAEPAAAAKAPPPVVHAVAVVSPLKNKAIASAVESGLKTNFLGRGVNAVSLHTLYNSSVPAVVEIRADLQARGFTHILCATPRRSIRFSSGPLAVPFATLDGCLTAFATGVYPTGEPTDTAWAVETSMASDRQAPIGGTLASPIPSSPGSAPIRVIKGTLRLFDLKTGELALQNIVQVKVPAELQGDLQTKLIVRGAWDSIEKSGILPKKP
jgi:hypothetical protein